MPALPDKPKPKLLRRIERAIVGFGMGIGAFFIERIVMRAVKKKGGSPKTAEPTPLKGTGGDIEHG